MNKKFFYYFISGLFLVAIGVGAGYKYAEYKGIINPSDKNAQDQNIPQDQQTDDNFPTSDLEVQDSNTQEDSSNKSDSGQNESNPENSKDLSYLNYVEWLSYKDPNYPEIIFKYPKGAKITRKTDTKYKTYTVKAVYKDLVITARKVLGGIGGVPYPVYSYNRIIYDTKFMWNGYPSWGIYALDNSTKDRIIYAYNPFNIVRRQQTNNIRFTVSLPLDGFKKEYISIMDMIGASAYGRNNHITKSGVPYYDVDLKRIYGIDNFQSFVIREVKKDQECEDIYVNHTITYMTYLLSESDGKIYLYTYDLKNKKHVTLSGQSKIGPFNTLNTVAGDGMVVWFDDTKYVFANTDTDKYYMADVKAKTLKQITKSEFELYTAHQ